jgi:hypothetical protein
LLYVIQEFRERFARGTFQEGVRHRLGEVGFDNIGFDDEGAVLMG